MLLIWKCCLNLVCLGIFKISPSQTQIQITERNEMLLLSLISHKPGFNCFTVLFLSLQGLKWSSVMLTGQRISTRSRLDSDWLKDWKKYWWHEPQNIIYLFQSIARPFEKWLGSAQQLNEAPCCQWNSRLLPFSQPRWPLIFVSTSNSKNEAERKLSRINDVKFIILV